MSPFFYLTLGIWQHSAEKTMHFAKQQQFAKHTERKKEKKVHLFLQIRNDKNEKVCLDSRERHFLKKEKKILSKSQF